MHLQTWLLNNDALMLVRQTQHTQVPSECTQSVMQDGAWCDALGLGPSFATPFQSCCHGQSGLSHSSSKNVRPRDLTHQVTSIVQRSGSADSVQGERGMPYVGVVPAIVNATRTLIKSDISGQNIMFVIISTSRATNLYFQTCAQTSHVKILTWPQ